ncbi:MAG TPA: hypothetical protein VMU75_00070 [Acidimicrobiales bacterium]|nr:hypothetical protein [Acidimicrobiales bacterium]
MAGKRDKRRHERRQHHQRVTTEARRERRQQAARAVDELLGQVESLLGAAADPGVEPEAFVERLGEVLDHDLAHRLFEQPEAAAAQGAIYARDLDEERALALVEALAARGGTDARYAWVAAGAAVRAGREDRADEILSALDAGADEAEDATALLARVRLERGRVADVLELLDARCAEDPTDEDLQRLRATALELADARQARAPGDGEPCSCGSGLVWPACCRDRERASLERFTSRAELYALREAVSAFVASDPALRDWLDERVEEWLAIVRGSAGLGTFDKLGGRDSLDELLRRDEAGAAGGYAQLASECSWLQGPHRAGAGEGHADADDQDSLLARFAADTSTPPRLGAAARSWLANARYGLWQLERTDAGPGVWLTDLVTRRSVYASVPEEQLEGLCRWSVLLGALVPVEGTWRSGGALVALDPTDADRLTELALQLADEVAHGLAAEQGITGIGPPRAMRAGQDVPPYGVLASLAEPLDGVVADLYHKVVGAGLAQLVGAAEAARRHTPRLTNTDGDPLELLSAAVPVADTAALRRALLASSDFEEDPDGSGLAWKGRRMSASEAASSLAEARAIAAEKGWSAPEEDPGEARHWIRGFWRLEPGKVVIEVNSRRRLEAALRLLHHHGVDGEPVIGSRVDPALDLPVPAGWRPSAHASSAEADEVWRRHWLDEKVPALGGTTPRRAAASPRSQPLLEKLLRQFEHDADRARERGERPMDTAELRRELGMEHWPEDVDEDEDEPPASGGGRRHIAERG